MSKATEAGMRLLLRVVPIVLASGLWTAPATAASFTIMFERNTDVSANELAFRTYATFGDMVTNQPSGADQFSPINIAAGFDTAGLTWDGTQFIVMFERNTDVATNELAFRTYATFGDMVANQPSGADQFSPINIAAGFDTSGLMAVWDLNGGGNGGTPVPEPGTLGLLGFGLAGLAATRRRKW